MKKTIVYLSIVVGLLAGLALQNVQSVESVAKSAQTSPTKLTSTVPLQTWVPLVPESTSTATPLPTATLISATVEQPVTTLNQNEQAAKDDIYFKESSNNPAAVNSGGCRGLGQACPGSKLPCGDDYACQDAWFTKYMESRYGSWAAAKAFRDAQCHTIHGCWW